MEFIEIFGSGSLKILSLDSSKTTNQASNLWREFPMEYFQF